VIGDDSHVCPVFASDLPHRSNSALILSEFPRRHGKRLVYLRLVKQIALTESCQRDLPQSRNFKGNACAIGEQLFFSSDHLCMKEEHHEST
jgi:hypothetical protein